jgi:hypothetical protein
MLDAEQFLDRVIAPGNFLALAFKGASRGMRHRFFPRDRVREAASFMRWATRQGMDCWHAVASYRDAELKTDKGQEKYFGARTQANAEALRCFWFDADIKRDGDNKDPSRVYPDLNAAIAALKPLKVSGFPLPNLWIRSGYGVHFYWVMEDALDRDTWTGYAEAFKQLLIKHGLKGDVGLTSDSARILRPVDGVNYKDPASPAPCYDMTPDGLKPFYPNTEVLPHLQLTTVVGLSGAAPNVPINQSLTKNAKAGMQRDARPHSFVRIVRHCGQAGRSLVERGANDDRELWHSMVGLAWFCDTRPAADAVGLAHPKYTPASTEAEWQQWAKDRQRKDFGAPSCARIDVLRPGICGACPHWGNISSPYTLGVDPDEPPVNNPNELPYGYQRHNGWIEHTRKVVGKQEYEWSRLIEGDITEVGVSASGEKKRLHFTYTCGKETRTVAVEETEIIGEPAKLKILFANRGVTLNLDNPVPFGRMLMAWIEKLRHSAQREPLPAIGWAKRGDEYLGFSIGGVCYRADSTEEPVASDAEALRDRKPTGKLETWHAAAALAGGGHPVTEAAIAIGFAAPLMEFTGEAGLCIAIMGKTATGKTSAFRAGTAIWSRPTSTMFSLDDTENYVHIRIGQAPGLPAYWDENVITKDRAQKVVSFVHKVTQGRDKGRATADSATRQSGEWNTLVAMSSNRSILDLVASETNETDAAMLRVFEINLERAMPYNLRAAPIIARFNDNYGTAGAIYAKHIAANVAAIRTALGRVKDWVGDKIGGMRSDERFYVAGICSILVGAAIAKKLGLLDFNVPAIGDELVATLLRLRSEREATIPVHNDRLMAIDVIDAYCNYHMQDGVVTKYLRPPGRYELERGFEVSNQTGIHKTPTPAYQIALKEAAVRINREHWRDWCATTHRNSRALVKLLIKEFSALPEERGAIGAGAHFSTPRARYIEVPLTSVELAGWIEAYLPKVAAGSNVMPLRPVR